MQVLRVGVGVDAVDVQLNVKDTADIAVLDRPNGMLIVTKAVMKFVPFGTEWLILDDAEQVGGPVDKSNIRFDMDVDDVRELQSILRDLMNAGSTLNIRLKHANRVRHHHNLIKAAVERYESKIK